MLSLQPAAQLANTLPVFPLSATSFFLHFSNEALKTGELPQK